MNKVWKNNPQALMVLARLIDKSQELLKINLVTYEDDLKYIFASTECKLVVDLLNYTASFQLLPSSLFSKDIGAEIERISNLLSAFSAALSYSVPPEYHGISVQIGGPANG